MKYIQLLLIFAGAILLNSCATILTGTTQRVTIDSYPPGAEIVIDGRIMGNTPARVNLDRDINHFMDDGKDIQLVLPGYYSEGYYLGVDIEPTCILNVLCPIGFALDAVTGAMVRFDSDYYNFRMIPVETNNQEEVSPATPSVLSDMEDSDDYEKLMKLVDMYEAGEITKEEFDAEKAMIFEKSRE